MPRKKQARAAKRTRTPKLADPAPTKRTATKRTAKKRPVTKPTAKKKASPRAKATASPKAKQAKQAKPAPTSPVSATLHARLDEALSDLRHLATTETLEGMARYAIPSDNALGVTMGDMRELGKRLGRDHELAAALWATGIYEARTLAAFVEEPELVTVTQMNAWARDFDSWAICDTVCFHLFDKTPHALGRVKAWANAGEEFVKRAAFALIASLTVHDKRAADETFEACLELIERAADDARNFVKKAVNWALRSVGKRNARLNQAAISLAARLSSASEASATWIGKDALRELQSASVSRRLENRRAAAQIVG